MTRRDQYAEFLKREDRIIFWSLFGPILVGAILFGLMFAVDTYRDRMYGKEPLLDIETTWWGEVERVTDCSGSKYTRCLIWFKGLDKAHSYPMSTFPGNYVAAGDRVGRDKYTYAHRTLECMRRNDIVDDCITKWR